MGAYVEDPADEFDFSSDWKEAVADGGTGSASFSHEAQESTRVGYIPAHKMRSAARFFLGYAEADTASPWRLRREQPHWDPEVPWLFAHSITFSPTVVEANTDNPNNEPYTASPFATDSNWAAKYKWRLATVKYRAFRCLFLPDSSIATPADEYKRNVQVTSSAKIEILSADGVSQLKFAETSTPAGPPPGGTGPGVGVAFPAPIGVLLPKASFTLEWLNVDRNYLSTNPYVFYPSKILSCMGKVNSVPIWGFPIGTLLCQPPDFVENPWPVASDTSQDAEYEILRSVTVRLHFDYFDPPTGAASPVTRGHRIFPSRTDGKFYLATRNGTTSLTQAFLEETTFSKIFEHISAP